MAKVYGGQNDHLLTEIKKHEKAAAAYKKGLKGENSVYYTLLNLNDNFTVQQNLKSFYSGNFDFVVIGPTGIFSIEVKKWNGVVTWNGDCICLNGKQVKDPLKQARRQAMEIHLILKRVLGKEIYVHPVLVFAAPIKLERVNGNIDRVILLSQKNLCDFIENQPKTLTNTREIEVALHPYMNQQQLALFSKVKLIASRLHRWIYRS
jgi:hypothetical protein